MKPIAFVAAALISVLCIVSCQKDEDVVVYPDFTQLRVGNYWIYERYTLDSLGNASPTGIVDSCYVEKDTLIQGKTYFKVVRPMIAGLTYDDTFVRDSLHYLVNAQGQILFSSQNFADTFDAYYITSGPADTVCRVIVKMADPNLAVSVPAGQFSTHSFKMSYQMYPNWSYNGSIRNMDTRYAEHVGIVSQTLPFFAGNPNYQQRRLIRYHVQ